MPGVPVRARSVTSLSCTPQNEDCVTAVTVAAVPSPRALQSSEMFREQPLCSSSDELRPDPLIVLFLSFKKGWSEVRASPNAA